MCKGLLNGLNLKCKVCWHHLRKVIIEFISSLHQKVAF